MTFNSITFLVFFVIVAILLLITKIDFKIKKENWLTQKWRQFKEWKRKTDLKIDYWSRKKPLRRKIYLNKFNKIS